MPDIERVAITTGGGDAPGLNAVIRAVVIACEKRSWECFGILDGYDGLLAPERHAEGGLRRLGRESVRGITHLGGTILGTTNRGDPFRFPTKRADGEVAFTDRSDDLLRAFEEQRLDALVAVGGDGSLAIADRLAKKGLTVVGVPKTIDNDLDQTVVTFGFDSAVSFATECLDRLHSTAEAHERVIVVEVMGRYAGWIALHAGIAGSADVILLPEIPYDAESVAAKIRERYGRGREFGIVIVAEGAAPRGGAPSVVERRKGVAERLGGVGSIVAAEISRMTGRESRVVVLGHLLRGGQPTSRDRILSLRFGAAAVRALEEGKTGQMVALDPPIVRYVPLELATKRMKAVPLDCDTVQTARDLGICLGD